MQERSTQLKGEYLFPLFIDRCYSLIQFLINRKEWTGKYQGQEKTVGSRIFKDKEALEKNDQ